MSQNPNPNQDQSTQPADPPKMPAQTPGQPNPVKNPDEKKADQKI